MGKIGVAKQPNGIAIFFKSLFGQDEIQVNSLEDINEDNIEKFNTTKETLKTLKDSTKNKISEIEKMHTIGVAKKSPNIKSARLQNKEKKYDIKVENIVKENVKSIKEDEKIQEK